METLSQYLRERIKELDDDFLSETPISEKQEAAEWLASKMASYLLESLEQFKKPSAYRLENLFSSYRRELDEIFKDELDEHYTRRLLQSIPEMVARTM